MLHLHFFSGIVYSQSIYISFFHCVCVWEGNIFFFKIDEDKKEECLVYSYRIFNVFFNCHFLEPKVLLL